MLEAARATMNMAVTSEITRGNTSHPSGGNKEMGLPELAWGGGGVLRGAALQDWTQEF